MISWLKNLIRPAQVVPSSQALPSVQPELSLAPVAANAAQNPAQVSTFTLVDNTQNILLQNAPRVIEPKKEPVQKESLEMAMFVMHKFASLMRVSGDKLITALKDSGDMFDKHPAHIREECISCQDYAGLAINTFKGMPRTELAIDSVSGELGAVCHHVCLLLKDGKLFVLDTHFWLVRLDMPDTYEQAHHDLPKQRLIPLEEWLEGMKNNLNKSGRGAQELQLSLRASGEEIKRIIESADELI